LLGLWNAHGSRKPFEPDPAKINIFIWGNLKGDLSMKQIKRIMAFALALVLALAMSITVFAEDGTSGTTVTVPKQGDTATITVQNVESGAVVTAYKYVEAKYNASGLVGYDVVDGLNKGETPDIENIENPTLDEIIALTDKIGTDKPLGAGITLDPTSDGSYTKDVAAGSYLILVTDVSSKIYNPMIVSVYYTKGGSDNTTNTDTANIDAATGTWELSGGTAIAKSEQPTVTKKIVSVTDDAGTVDTSENGIHDAAVGDTVEFKITTTIPQYSTDYKVNGFVFKLTDTLAQGFDYNNDVKVTIDDAQYSSDTNITFEDSTNTLTIDLSSVAVDNFGKDVTVTYTAKLLDDTTKTEYNKTATGNGNTNDVTLTYSTAPNESDTGTATATTHTYTFNLEGSDGVSLITKTGEDTDGDGKNDPLKGADFTLTKLDSDSNETDVSVTETSDENGKVSFTGLDAGTYHLQETKAPSGYSLNDTVYTVKIVATYNLDGTIKTLSITDEEGNNLLEKGITINDTSLATLPSTGGIGTTIFTIAGCLIMIAAAGMYFASRRKSAK
jgi:fimbrial isopeptide formation D2 family protein/LPXTG-motif cell wall-anchored protein